MSRIDDLIAELCPDLPAGRQVGWSDPAELPCENDSWYAYVLLCNDGTLYKGFTTNLKARYLRHLSGDGAAHTRKHQPLCVLYYETCENEQDAVQREKYLKSGSGREWLKRKIKETSHVRN
ncbi:GIY-YIG nuclease family protein [Mariprofundus erugo]|uniref:GIY-YIG nuclease family protein n=1 Tax=Mariprofundus erugo TaxID=2528639 RepID=A0A5R9GSY0_9PROT|nr:GIY-YIG nuclease family protein [Mariprofundus erugo]TLS68175.1 GIY-YIG nuclease family protein [Mariprofundus erugo]